MRAAAVPKGSHTAAHALRRWTLIAPAFCSGLAKCGRKPSRAPRLLVVWLGGRCLALAGRLLREATRVSPSHCGGTAANVTVNSLTQSLEAVPPQCQRRRPPALATRTIQSRHSSLEWLGGRASVCRVEFRCGHGQDLQAGVGAARPGEERQAATNFQYRRPPGREAVRHGWRRFVCHFSHPLAPPPAALATAQPAHSRPRRPRARTRQHDQDLEHGPAPQRVG